MSRKRDWFVTKLGLEKHIKNNRIKYTNSLIEKALDNAICIGYLEDWEKEDLFKDTKYSITLNHKKFGVKPKPRKKTPKTNHCRQCTKNSGVMVE